MNRRTLLLGASTLGLAAFAGGAYVLTQRRAAEAEAEAPLLVLEVDDGVRCVLIETHEREAAQCGRGVAQNLHVHIRLGTGATLQHLRMAAPGPQDHLAHHVHARPAPHAGSGGILPLRIPPPAG